MKQNDPESWKRAVEMDHLLRTDGTALKRGMREELYLHFSLKPLDEVDLNPQGSLGFARDCEGVCGV